jgi:hypothetical protein
VEQYPRLVAVVGLTLSRGPMIEAAHALDRAGVPIVADLVTADGFDRTNFAHTAATCAGNLLRDGSLGGFYRLTLPNHEYLDQLAAYLRGTGQLGPGQAVQVTQYGYQADTFACTNVLRVNSLLTPARDPIAFELSDRNNDAMDQLITKVTPICASGSPVRTVFYTARAVDLANFIIALGQACPKGITVAGPTDSTRLLTTELDDRIDTQRRAALDVLRAGKVKLVYPATTTPDQVAAEPGYAGLQEAFRGAFAGSDTALFPLDAAELADTWIVNAHDAFYVTAAAVHALHANRQAYTRTHVAANLSAFQIAGAAQGTLSFDTTGTREGEPVVVRLCATAAGPVVRRASAGTSCPAQPVNPGS